MSIHSQLPYDQSTSHARIPAGGIHLIASIDSASEAQFTASFFGSTKALHGEVAIPSAATTTHNHSNQQYSITAVTTSAGAVAERYAYSAYGEPTILDGSGSTLSSSAINHRYSYTGREWDATVGLYHFRARWMSPKTGRFLGRDPIGFVDGNCLYRLYFTLASLDPEGMAILDADPTSSNGVQWCYHNFPSRPGRVIQGDTRDWVYEANCRCVCCEDAHCEGFEKKIPLCTVVVRLSVRIGRKRSLGWTEENTYGHEQYHVDNLLGEARRVQSLLTSFESGCMHPAVCDVVAKNQEDLANELLSRFLVEESNHTRPNPRDGVSYPPIHEMPKDPQPGCKSPSEPKPFKEPPCAKKYR